ncbi:chemotaxis protein CheA [Novosphingobium sp. ZW T3_23]|uniref:chemotaxis protein CheA n=1 Tax=Novosphingobium sp. ZW T3_23 TaxID=3378084 RepID=UPI003853FA90
MMDELLEQFLIEGRDLVAQAQGDLAALARQPERRDVLDSLFRAVHTLKGSVALFDMAPAEGLLHRAETRLDHARRNHAQGGDAPLSVPDLTALVAVIDQVDRWIDLLERDGSLPADAEACAAGLGIGLNGALDGPDEGAVSVREPGPDAPEPPRRDAAEHIPAWLEATMAQAPSFGQAATAFRYVPDADCFFRGEDPLAVARAVPDLLALDLSFPPDAPGIDDFEPFRCVLRIVGLSAAPQDRVRAAFRMMPNQVEVVALGAPEREDKNPAGDVGDVPMEPGESGGMLRVSATRLDVLADEVGQMAVALNALEAAVERAATSDRVLAAELRRVQGALAGSLNRLSSTVAEVRRVPLQPVLRRLPRLARDLAASLGKDVRFVLSGEGVEVDKQVADAIFEPLLHLVRNAVDHGIETADARVGAGKPASGTISLSFRRSGDHLAVKVSDDGKGIEPVAIRRAAVGKGLIGTKEAAALTDRQALRLIFAPGFSTSRSVTGVSGRGVGMDAVQRAVERLQGSIEIESAPGRGTDIAIRLPLNAILTRLVTVRVGDERYGLRMDQIHETLRVDAAAIEELGHGRACVIRDRTVPVLSLAALLGHAEGLEQVRAGNAEADWARLVVTGASGERIALRVDAVGERIDAAVRERSGLLAAMPAIGGTTLDADGGVLLVLDLPELLS